MCRYVWNSYGHCCPIGCASHCFISQSPCISKSMRQCMRYCCYFRSNSQRPPRREYSCHRQFIRDAPNHVKPEEGAGLGELRPCPSHRQRETAISIKHIWCQHHELWNLLHVWRDRDSSRNPQNTRAERQSFSNMLERLGIIPYNFRCSKNCPTYQSPLQGLPKLET